MMSPKSSLVRAMDRQKTVLQMQVQISNRLDQMTCSKRHLRTLYAFSKVEELTQIYWKKTRLKSCSTSTWIMKRSWQNSKWKSRRMMMKMVKVKLTRNRTQCSLTSTLFAKITLYSCFLRSIVSHKFFPMSLSNSCYKSSRWAVSRPFASAITPWAPTASLTTCISTCFALSFSSARASRLSRSSRLTSSYSLSQAWSTKRRVRLTCSIAECALVKCLAGPCKHCC